jgi:hypothetical protein
MYRIDDSLPCTSASVHTDTNNLDDYDNNYDNYDNYDYDNYDNAYDENHESMDSSDITNSISSNMKKLDIDNNTNNNKIDNNTNNNTTNNKMFNDIELSNFVLRVDELLTLIPLTHNAKIKEVINILMNQLSITRHKLSQTEYLLPSVIEERDCLRQTVNNTNDIIESIQQTMTKVNKLIDHAQQITVLYNDHEI